MLMIVVAGMFILAPESFRVKISHIVIMVLMCFIQDDIKIARVQS